MIWAGMAEDRVDKTLGDLGFNDLAVWGMDVELSLTLSCFVLRIYWIGSLFLLLLNSSQIKPSNVKMLPAAKMAESLLF